MKIDDRLLELLNEYYCGGEEITPQSDLYEDMGISGDDADELLNKYRKMFGVSLTGFDFTAHFPCEADRGVLYAVLWVFNAIMRGSRPAVETQPTGVDRPGGDDSRTDGGDIHVQLLCTDARRQVARDRGRTTYPQRRQLPLRSHHGAVFHRFDTRDYDFGPTTMTT